MKMLRKCHLAWFGDYDRLVTGLVAAHEAYVGNTFHSEPWWIVLGVHTELRKR